MANNISRTCPKCGMNLGQKHLCPICDQPAENTENRSNPAAEAGGNAAQTDSQTTGYISRVIDFIGRHPDDWDDEFNVFFDGLPEEHDYMRCHDACSKVSGIVKKNMPVSGRISGSMTINAMNELKTVFPDLSDKDARGLAMDLLRKHLEAYFAPPSPGSDSEVMDLYRRAMEQNDVKAQNRLGYAYAHGEGVSEDKAEAVKWYRKAAEQGNASAQYNIGLCYYRGRGVSENKTEAAKWFRKAAEQGDEDARKRLDEDKELRLLNKPLSL